MNTDKIVLSNEALLHSHPLIRAWYIYQSTVHIFKIPESEAPHHPLTRTLHVEWRNQAHLMIMQLNSTKHCEDVVSLFPFGTAEYEELLSYWLKLCQSKDDIEGVWPHAVKLDISKKDKTKLFLSEVIDRLKYFNKSAQDLAEIASLGKKLPAEDCFRKVSDEIEKVRIMFLLGSADIIATAEGAHNLLKHCPQFSPNGMTSAWNKIQARKLELWTIEANRALSEKNKVAAEELLNIAPPNDECRGRRTKLAKLLAP